MSTVTHSTGDPSLRNVFFFSESVKMALKILVDQGYELAQPHPPTLFCLLEFDGVRLATSHNEVRNGKVKFNEEAEFQIKKSGNLRIQLCSVDGKKSVLSLNVSLQIEILILQTSFSITVYP